MKKLLGLLLVCLLAFFISCSDNKQEEDTKTTVTVTLFLNNEVVEEKEVEKGSTVDFDISGDFIFLGWYDLNDEVCLNNTVINEDEELFARVIPYGTEYKITYHLTEDADFKDLWYAKNYKVGEELVLENPVRKLNYEFTGWYYNGEVITKIPANTYGDIDLYDSWVDNNIYHTINYNPDGGTFSEEAESTIMEGVFYQLPYVTKENYYFRGWYEEEDFKTRVYNIAKENTKDYTLYAKFELKTRENTYVSIMGDSISTYAGLIPEDAGPYYPNYCDFPADKTYFLQAINKLGYNFLKNNSYSASKMTGDVVSNGVLIPAATSDKRIQGLSDGVHDPDILIVHMGTNDYSQGVTTEKFSQSIKLFCKKVRALYDDVEIYFCLHPYNGYGLGYVAKREAYNDVITELSASDQCNYHVIDLTTCWGADDYATYINSNAHPNLAGFNKMAEVIFLEIRKTHKI